MNATSTENSKKSTKKREPSCASLEAKLASLEAKQKQIINQLEEKKRIIEEQERINDKVMCSLIGLIITDSIINFENDKLDAIVKFVNKYLEWAHQSTSASNKNTRTRELINVVKYLLKKANIQLEKSDINIITNNIKNKILTTIKTNQDNELTENAKAEKPKAETAPKPQQNPTPKQPEPTQKPVTTTNPNLSTQTGQQGKDTVRNNNNHGMKTTVHNSNSSGMSIEEEDGWIER